MSEKFKIYFTDGETIEMELKRFHLKDEIFELHDKDSDTVDYTFISFNDVAAISSNRLEQKENDVLFNVYLKKHAEPLEIPAVGFEISNNSEIIFHHVNYYGTKTNLRNLYIAKSSVLAIIPYYLVSAGESNVSTQ